MPKVNPGYGSAGRVNILKKVKVNGAWNLCPAVVESNGKLKDKVRVKGVVEIHPEARRGAEASTAVLMPRGAAQAELTEGAERSLEFAGK